MSEDPWRSATPAKKRRFSQEDVADLQEIEQKMLHVENRLAELTEVELYSVSENRAEAEADWLQHKDSVVVRIHYAGERTAEDTRDALARTEMSAEGIPGIRLFRDYERLHAKEKAMNTEIKALQSRLTALQSAAKSIRGAVGLD